jgi:hypothetical protein
MLVAPTALSISAGAALQSANHVLARYHADQPLIAFDHRHAPDAVVYHKLKHPRQLGFFPDIDKFRNVALRDTVVVFRVMESAVVCSRNLYKV